MCSANPKRANRAVTSGISSARDFLWLRARGEQDVFNGCHVWEKIIALEHHTNAATHGFRVQTGNGDVRAIQKDLSVLNRFETD